MLYLRSFINIFFVFAFPISMLLIFGGIYGNEPAELFGGRGTVDVSAPAYSCIVISVTGLMSLPLTLSQYRERKILKRFMASPIDPYEILVVQVLINLIMVAVGIILLIIVGMAIFDMHLYGKLLPILISLIIIVLSIFSIGLLIAGVSKNTRIANTISYLVYFPMIFLSGATIPIEMMPSTMRSIVKILPLTYGVELLKGVWLGGKLADYITDIVVLISVFIICTAISIKAFRWE
jgi:ABC-2 type transport system permease protein